MDVYGDGHRLFIQSMMSRGIMNVSEVKEVLSGSLFGTFSFVTLAQFPHLILLQSKLSRSPAKLDCTLIWF